jgi:xanthine dehydrogenase accessory factor
MMESDIFEEIYNRQKAGHPFVLAIIIKTSGSSPRRAGAKMLVFPDGTAAGTIGGGNFEKLVIDDSLTLLESNAGHLLKTYTFSKAGAGATGMSCGGEAEVFMEVNVRPRKLVIFGAGHIGRELVRLAAGSGFLISVVDDRPDILSRYDRSVTTIRTDHEYQEHFPSLDSDSYVVIVTRSHNIDRLILERVLKGKYTYVGMIGSKAKIAKLFSILEESGIDRARLDQVCAPIGLDIKGEGPYEIAVSIMAELIAAKNKIVRSRV